MTTFLITTLSGTMFRPASSLYTTQINAEAANDMIGPDIRIAGVSSLMRNLLADIFPALDTSTTYNNIVLEPGDEALLVTYSGPKLPYSGRDFSLLFTRVEIEEYEYAA